jgi:TIR domain-containing protein
MVKVFLSHSSVDKPFVRMFKDDLVAAGFEAWLDEAKLKIGDSLPIEIGGAIDGADFFLAFLSTSSVESNWVKKEVAIATTKEINGGNVRVLPLLLDDCKVPPLLIDKLRADFRQATLYDSEFRKVLACIDSGVLPETAYSFYCLTIGATRKDQLVLTAKASDKVKHWVIDYLIAALDKRQSHAERYWIYIALAEIGGDRAESAVKRGLAEGGFGGSGAKEAWKLLGH